MHIHLNRMLEVDEVLNVGMSAEETLVLSTPSSEKDCSFMQHTLTTEVGFPNNSPKWIICMLA